jgi:8-oxo-dGTP pyrophosphatase MutT (NUDIX family)
MTKRDARIQAAVVRENNILVLSVLIDDGRRFWLLPGGGAEAHDLDEAATAVREVREETECQISVERFLFELPANAGDSTYRRYRTYLCRIAGGDMPRPGIRDGIATITHVAWLPLDDETKWEQSIREDRFLFPQLIAIQSALREPDGGFLSQAHSVSR